MVDKGICPAVAFIFCILIHTLTSCGDSKESTQQGKYVRVYTRSNLKEVVCLHPSGSFQQTLEENGKVIASNSGHWKLISSNSGHSEKWPSGKPVFLFSGWTEYDLGIYRKMEGEVVDWVKLPSVETSAIQLGSKKFGFDLDGGSWYEKP